MSQEYQFEIAPLPASLKSRLDFIIQNVQHFWENCPHYAHFTNTGVTHSERTHRLLAQLAQELPPSNQLTADEVFIVSAATFLYEIGTQSPRLSPVLDFEFQVGTQLSSEQLLKIRQVKHLLSQELILGSGDLDNSFLSLGVAQDDYTLLIADVCRWISDEPLDLVPEMLPVHGIPVRMRLLVALLRLADQLYIDSSRVNLDLLERAGLPEKRFARWWAYHYTQILPIDRGQIRFHYFTPFEQREYLGHIRALIEPDFEFDNNPTMRLLLDQYNLRLIPPHKPSLGRYDQSANFQRPMHDEMLVFLRQEVHPILTPAIPEPEAVLENSEVCLLVLDYENFVIQLGLEGYFLSADQISSYVIQLRNYAVKEFDGVIDCLAIGHWKRMDLLSTAQMLDKWVYNLITLESDENAADKLSEILLARAHTNNPPKRFILVTPRVDMARTVLKLKQDEKRISTWMTRTPDSEIFQGGFGNKYSFLNLVLNLGTPQPLAVSAFENCESACILRIYDELANSSSDILLSDVRNTLEQIERLSGQAGWWQSWLFYKGILEDVAERPGYVKFNQKHSNVERVTQMRTIVLDTLQALYSRDPRVSQDILLSKLRARASRFFRQDSSVLHFLELLKDEDLVHQDVNPWLDTQPFWQLNASHREFINLNLRASPYESENKLRVPTGTHEEADAESIHAKTEANPANPIRVFISYAHEDVAMVNSFYQRLSKGGFKPWMDKKDLFAGEKWRESIEKAIKQSHCCIVCLTKNSVKEGFLQKEIRIALDICDQMPENGIFLIPIRLEDCYVPEALQNIHYVDLSDEDSWSQIERSIRHAYQTRVGAR